jgi:hypothetical protein
MNIHNVFGEHFHGNKKGVKSAAYEEERRELLQDMDDITRRLSEIQYEYDLITESELIDAAIYEELALKARYAYLLRRAKEMKIQCRMVVSG